MNSESTAKDASFVGATVVKLPPPKKKTPGASSSTTHHLDPDTILDSMDNFCQKEDNNSTSTNSKLDVLEFLNHHFMTESSLVNALPGLREGLSERLSGLEDKIQGALQNQADLAEANQKDVAIAKSSITSLTMRIKLVQEKAALSEQAVLQITKDMKRLDYAKQHLSKTITAMKRLHMLLHAVSQLQHIASDKATNTTEADYRNAAHILDAIHLLQSHFEAYIPSIARIQHIYDTIQSLEQQFYNTILFAFRHTGLGLSKALSKMTSPQKNDETPPLLLSSHTLADACHVITALGANKKIEFISLFCSDHLEPYVLLFDPNNSTSSNNTTTTAATTNPASTENKPSFKLKLPSSATDISTSLHGTGNSNTNNPNSFLLNDENVSCQNPNPASLDQMERRYSWFRRTLRELDDKFTNVFPNRWNVHYIFTKTFLNITKSHLELLFSTSDQTKKKDRDSQNVTILLKALQKTILFEKEMTAWLQRDYRTVFISPSVTDKAQKHRHDDDDDDEDQEEALEFDETGKAVVATSAEGIRIKYERKMKERKKKQEQTEKTNGTTTKNVTLFPSTTQESATTLRDDNDDDDQKAPEPVPPLMGMASSIFDSHMGPYIAQEEQYMGEQLQSTVTDATVDTRGELPVFTSSTNLFVYMKNSITRCTSLTRGQTFYMLFQAFQKTLTKYAALLSNKYPQSSNNTAINIAGVGAISVSLPGTNNPVVSASSSNNNSNNINAVIKIPPGEETTICHVIDTCEYCADTVEALQDLIKDKIEDPYKAKIDMYEQQECFHDVIAKGLIVLVSGLTQRMEVALKEMSTNTNWATLNVVGEESAYVRTMHSSIQPFVLTVRSVLPPTYFRNFCDKFASSFTSTFTNALLKQKRISESGTQQLLLDVYNLKTLLLKLPVMTEPSKNTASATSSFAPKSAGSTIAPAMYTKMVTKQFQRIEILLKLVGTPPELLIDVFKVQWENGSALDLQTVMNLKGMKRNEQAAMLERFGVDPVTAMKGASMGATATSNLTENIQALQDKSSDVAAKVNSDLFQMRQKVEDFRRAFR